MSITKGFEDHANKAGNYKDRAIVYSMVDVDKLLAHARALEAMLMKHEWADKSDDGTRWCPECYGGMTWEGHSPDCQLAKLLDETETKEME
jgi:hypothetical protein